MDWFEDKDTQVFCLFVEHYPTLKAAQAATPEQLTEFFTSHKVVRRRAIARPIEQIAHGSPLTEDAAIVVPSQWLVQALTHQLKGLLKTLNEINDKIAALFADHPDAEFFANLPGAGPHLAPRLLVAFGEDRTRYPQAQDLLRYSGIAPVTESSGNKCWVHWRWSCPTFCDKHSLSGQTSPANSRCGQMPSTNYSAKKARLIRWQCGHSRSSGFGFCFAVGKMMNRMMR
ncbi:transposase [Leptolyngbya sp. NK1-12]|uniref:Transposase n=1 Tax=Leptolyngbya sp. NK1-12 TaxID=2547451 RepID=A0AA96WDQ9_9CYAN|nr:transposase [Leptolyngbya sp. NK1-12]